MPVTVDTACGHGHLVATVAHLVDKRLVRLVHEHVVDKVGRRLGRAARRLLDVGVGDVGRAGWRGRTATAGACAAAVGRRRGAILVGDVEQRLVDVRHEAGQTLGEHDEAVALDEGVEWRYGELLVVERVAAARPLLHFLVVVARSQHQADVVLDTATRRLQINVQHLRQTTVVGQRFARTSATNVQQQKLLKLFKVENK